MKRTVEPFKSMKEFCSAMCNSCGSEWYCPTYCDVLKKAEKIGLERINKSYIRNDEDLEKVTRFIKRAKF